MSSAALAQNNNQLNLANSTPKPKYFHYVKGPNSYATPVTESSKKESESWVSQVTAYLAWANSQLRKHPIDPSPITNLDSSMRDGTVFARIIRVVSGCEITSINYKPKSKEDCVANCEEVIKFMTETNIKMHHISPIDIVNCQVKSIMRLILALAAHYKPSSVRQSSSSKAVSKDTSATFMQSACVAISQAKHALMKSTSTQYYNSEETNGFSHKRSSTIETSTPAKNDSDCQMVSSVIEEDTNLDLLSELAMAKEQLLMLHAMISSGETNASHDSSNSEREDQSAHVKELSEQLVTSTQQLSETRLALSRTRSYVAEVTASRDSLHRKLVDQQRQTICAESRVAEMSRQVETLLTEKTCLLARLAEAKAASLQHAHLNNQHVNNHQQLFKGTGHKNTMLHAAPITQSRQPTSCLLSPRSGGDSSSSGCSPPTLAPLIETTVLYHTGDPRGAGQSLEPPFACTLRGRKPPLLRDLRVLFDSDVTRHRYHFKTFDAELGVVREELTRDDDPLPMWNNHKVVCWVQPQLIQTSQV